MYEHSSMSKNTKNEKYSAEYIKTDSWGLKRTEYVFFFALAIGTRIFFTRHWLYI